MTPYVQDADFGIELNEEYARMCAQRLQQLSLLAEEGAA